MESLCSGLDKAGGVPDGRERIIRNVAVVFVPYVWKDDQ